LKEQLSRAEKLSSLGEMAAAISHEIRNPLGIIRSSAELLKKKMQQFDKSNTIPNIIVEEANRLNNIITDFLDFAKPKNPNLIPCHIDEIIEKNVKFLSSQMEEKNYIIERRYDSNLPKVLVDVDMMYQAFLNIFINSMQSMPDGGIIAVDISSENSKILILFKDEGEGISEEIIHKIWDPFFTTKEMGTGLGLGIIKNIIESHGGTLNIDNRPEKGVQLSIALPVNRN
jgi:signal transduction histidine kinase